MSFEGTPPTSAIPGFGNYPTGAALALGICAALVKQQKTGKGDKVSISLLGNAIWNLGIVLTAASERYKAKWPKLLLSPSTPLTTVYKSKDNQWLLLSVLQPDRYWPAICKVIGRPELGSDERYNTIRGQQANKTEIVQILNEEFAKKDCAEWMKLLRENDLAFEKLRHFSEIANDEQAWANDYLIEYTYKNGAKSLLPNFPIRYESVGTNKPKGAGLVGADKKDILHELGYSENEIDEIS